MNEQKYMKIPNKSNLSLGHRNNNNHSFVDSMKAKESRTDQTTSDKLDTSELLDIVNSFSGFENINEDMNAEESNIEPSYDYNYNKRKPLSVERVTKELSMSSNRYSTASFHPSTIIFENDFIPILTPDSPGPPHMRRRNSAAQFYNYHDEYSNYKTADISLTPKFSNPLHSSHPLADDNFVRGTKQEPVSTIKISKHVPLRIMHSPPLYQILNTASHTKNNTVDEGVNRGQTVNAPTTPSNKVITSNHDMTKVTGSSLNYKSVDNPQSYNTIYRGASSNLAPTSINKYHRISQMVNKKHNQNLGRRHHKIIPKRRKNVSINRHRMIPERRGSVATKDRSSFVSNIWDSLYNNLFSWDRNKAAVRPQPRMLS